MGRDLNPRKDGLRSPVCLGGGVNIVVEVERLMIGDGQQVYAGLPSFRYYIFGRVAFAVRV